MSISSLPDEIIYMICEKINRVIDLVSFSSCSKRLNFICKDVKYENDVYDIKNKENIKRALDFNKSIKLKLDISNNKNISDVSMLGNVYDLDLSCCRNISDVSMLGNVHDLNLSYCYNISDVSMLTGVHTLNL